MVSEYCGAAAWVSFIGVVRLMQVAIDRLNRLDLLKTRDMEVLRSADGGTLQRMTLRFGLRAGCVYGDRSTATLWVRPVVGRFCSGVRGKLKKRPTAGRTHRVSQRSRSRGFS